MDSPAAAELRHVLTYYDLGELVDFEKNDRGFVNTAYAIGVLAAGERKRYFLRKYKRGIAEEEIVFEHSLIEHLAAGGAPVARIHHTRTGESYLRCSEAEDDAAPIFYTIFDFLPGDDRLTWIDPVLTERELAGSAAVLAQLHQDVAGFTPPGRRLEPKILELLPVIAETWSGCPARSKGTIFDARIQEQLSALGSNISATIATLQDEAVGSLPQIVIHGDYHPGNLKFSGEQVTGVFDFDWSKVDFRLFDLGLALWYFCTSWHGSEDGKLRLDWMRGFLHAYQETLAAQRGARVITPEEVRYLPAMISAGNLYVLHWTVLDYFAKDVNPAEYLVFLDHSLNFARWYGEPENYEALERMIASAVRPAVQD